MNDIFGGAFRYLLSRKKLVLFNIISMASGILLIDYSLSIGGPDARNSNASGFYISMAIILGFLSFSLIYMAIRSQSLYCARENEFMIRLKLGSGINRILGQLFLEGVLQWVSSIVLAIAVSDILENLSHHTKCAIAFELNGSRAGLFYFSAGWFLLFVLYMLKQKKKLTRLEAGDSHRL